MDLLKAETRSQQCLGWKAHVHLLWRPNHLDYVVYLGPQSLPSHDVHVGDVVTCKHVHRPMHMESILKKRAKNGK